MNLMEEMHEQGVSKINYIYFTKDKTEDKIHKLQVLAFQVPSGTRINNHTSGIYQGSDRRSVNQAIIRNWFWETEGWYNGEEQGDVFTCLKVLGDEKEESTKVKFKTGANSTWPNANRLEESNAERI